MERRQHEETVEGSRSHQSTLTGTLALKNFTIPRKKRTSGEVHLECCSEGSRDYSLIQTKLNDFKLDTRKDRANAWVWKEVCLVHNEDLLKKFSEKRAEMRAKGRHGREMEERFCFLAATDQMTEQIYQHGLQVGTTTQHALGKPSYGVYLFKHVDVALKSASTSAKKLFIFKVLYGKVKKIAPSLEWNKTPDPTVAFDCHMCKDAVSHRDTLHQQVLGSAVFLFDFNEKQELHEIPRQCLPYAMASFIPFSSAFQTVPLNLPLSSSTLPIGQVHALENTVDQFKACTVAERRGKGNAATITFKRFGAPGCFETDYTPQKTDMQNTQSLNPKQYWIAASEDSGSSSCSVPVVDHTAPSQNWLSNHKQNAASTHGRNDNQRDTMPQTPVDKISTIVYSSRFVRDPRLSRQDANQQSNCLKAEAANSGFDDRKCKPVHQNQEDYNGFESEELSSTEGQRDYETKSEHTPALPSMRLFKMKFHKYAAYFRMNEEERRQKIWSLENMSEEQKQELADRIHFYDIYYQKYKKGLLFQKPNQNSSLSQTETKENILRTNNRGSASDNSDLINKEERSSTHFHETKHPDHPESNSVVLTETGKNCLLENSLLLGSLNLNLTNEKNDLKLNHSYVNSLVEIPNIDSSCKRSNNSTIMDIASFIDVSSCCNLCSAMMENEKKNVKIFNSVKAMGSFKHGEVSPELDMETVQLDNSTQKLYKRLDQLLPSKNQKPVSSTKAYLRPTDTISNLKIDTEDPYFTVTLKANKTSTDIKETLSLSERFSQLKCRQTKMARRNNESCSSEAHKVNATCNAELIQLLAQKYNKSKILKHRILSRSASEKTSFIKHHTALSLRHSLKRSKYVKKTYFWLAKKSRSRKIVAHATVKATSNYLPQTVLTEKKDPDSNFRIASRTSDDDNAAQKANVIPQAPTSPISTELPPSQDFNIVPESEEKLINLTEPYSEDLCKIDSVKATNDSTSSSIQVMVDEGEPVKAAEHQTCLDCTKEHKENMLLKGTSEAMEMSIDNNVDDSENLPIYDCGASETHGDVTEVQTTMSPSETSETGTIKQCFEESEHTPAEILNMNKSDLDISTKTSNGKSVSSTGTEVLEDTTSDFKQCGTNNIVLDLTVDDPALSGECGISEATKSSNTDLVPKSARTLEVKDKPKQNKNEDRNSPETQLISKLRDYLTKFESSVKKQESVSEDLTERPVVWITLDSTAHKQQLFEKGQYCMVNLPCLVPNESDDVTKRNSSECTETNKVPRSDAQIGTDVCLLVPVQSKRGRRSSQYKRASRHRSSRSSVTSVSPDSTSALDIVKDNSHLPLANENHQKAGSPEISFNNDQIQMQRKTTTGQQKPLVNLDCEQKSIVNIDDGNVSSTLAGNEYNISDISDTLKMADQTASLTELGSLQSKCKNMLEHFISSFERDQKMPFKQTFVSRHLILDQYLDHPPAEVDLKYEAINSYLELQMMMEAWQFVENKMNFLRGKPTFRSLLWYDSSLYGELYKGDVGFQQQSSLFASFQKILSQEGYSKLQEYYRAVSSLHQPLRTAPDASYYMYLKSKRELLEAEAALRNPHDMKSFFLSVPVASTINFGDSLEQLEKVHKVIMTFVETPSDQLPGIFDVGKAEHLSITCRYLQEKGLFIRSCKEGIGKISWFGIEHLLYDASKVLVWQDVDRGAPNEALETYRNSNPQIIFGVTESGVTLVNKVEQPALSTDGPTKQKSDSARKRKCLQLWMSSEPSVAQSMKSGKKLDYKMAKRRVSHPPVAHCDMNEKGVNPIFQTTPATHVENPSPYYAHPQRMDPQWGMVGAPGIDWKRPNFVPPSTSHAHSEIKSRILSKRRRTFSHSQERRSFTEVQRPRWPSVSNPQASLREDSCGTHSAFESVKYQQNNTTAHCPGQVNQFSLAMTQPYSLPNCPVNPNLVSSPLSVQALTHVPVPSSITTIHYPYFLLNGQTYTTGSTGAIHPDTRYYPSTI